MKPQRKRGTAFLEDSSRERMYLMPFLVDIGLPPSDGIVPRRVVLLGKDVVQARLVVGELFL